VVVGAFVAQPLSRELIDVVDVAVHPGRCSSGWRVSSDEGCRWTAIHPVTLRGRFGATTHPTDIEPKG
jgi:hypothetical protein